MTTREDPSNLKTKSLLERDFIGYGENTPDPKWPNNAKIAIFLDNFSMQKYVKSRIQDPNKI